MSEFLMQPKVDFAFKQIMQNQRARVGFLSAVLKLPPEDIRETQIVDPHLNKLHRGDKLGILDVRVCLNDDTEIDIEIQLAPFSAWTKRVLFYLAKLYGQQLKEGEPYERLKKCISISVLDFELFPEEKEFYSCFHLWEDRRQFLYTDQLELHVIELPKLPEECQEESSILLWAKFLNAEEKEEIDMLSKKSPYIEAACETLRVISQDEQKQMEYLAREKAIRDHNQLMLEARQSALRDYEQILLARDKTIGNYEQIVLAKDKAISDYEQTMLAKDKAISDYEQTMLAKDKAISDYEQTVLAKDKAISDYEQMMLEIQEQIGQLKIEMQQQSDQLKLEAQRNEQRGIEAMILDGIEENFSKEKILLKLQRRFALTEEQANQYYIMVTLG